MHEVLKPQENHCKIIYCKLFINILKLFLELLQNAMALLFHHFDSTVATEGAPFWASICYIIALIYLIIFWFSVISGEITGYQLEV